ncbi:hypothetical protein A9Q81_11475 [Gammaproteobacteria bacterium 42_54_T18]|nr:hypothetical protein A9Q81_11475 [Gammaproteobacteria bacterium 42_54_T18]
MKSLFKSIFRSGELKSEEGLSHISGLKIGDMIELDNDFSLPSMLRGNTFQVVLRALYEYEEAEEIEWVLKGDDGTTVFLSYDSDDGDEIVTFGLKLTPADVENIFNLEEFSAVFDDEYSAVLTDVSAVENYSAWLGAKYLRTEYAEPGYYHKSGELSGQGEPFDHFELVSDCGNFGLNIEVWDGGETDVSISMSRPLNIIKNYWGHK